MRTTNYSDSQTCRYCGNMGPMRIAGSVEDAKDNEDAFVPEHGTVCEVLICSECERPTIRAGFYHDGMDEEDWLPTVLYPAERKTLSSLPRLVQQEYEAARAVAQVSPNAYAAMLGRALDAVCVDRGAAGDTLHKRLEDLAGKGEIPKNLADMAQNVHQSRNVGAHADLGSLIPAEIPFLGSLSYVVPEYIYEAPRMVEAAQKRYEALHIK